MVAALLIVFAFCIGFFLTRKIVGWAPAIGLLQLPNARSSHSLPTPSGGGIAIAIAVTVCGVALALWLPSATSIYPLLGLGCVIATLGFVDDVYDLRAALRFLVQTAVVSGTLLVFWPLPETFAFGLSIAGVSLWVLLALGGVWWVNLFNFMDGIDGLAGSQALLHLAGLIALWLSQAGGGAALHSPVFVLALIAGAGTLGFLCYNWPPARIFMGDAGSNFLAYIVLSVALAIVGSGFAGYGTIIALTSVFLADATVTLLRRLVQGQRPWHAHKSHAYQRLSRRFGHAKVTIAYAMLTAFCALPAAFASVHWSALEWPIALGTVVFMSLLALACGAGRAGD